MKLARVNSLLLTAIILINGYLILAPIFPQFLYWWQDHHHTPTSTAALTKKLATPPTPSNPIPTGNWLIVPSMHLDDQIFEGSNMSVLAKGPWRRPNTSTPDKGGNTVIAGHRYTYTNPRGTFYYLNDVHVGDEVAVYWQGKQYTYKVSSVNEVKPTDSAVEAPTTDAQLTLYTCTPLWLPEDRLVVVAQLETIS